MNGFRSGGWVVDTIKAHFYDAIFENGYMLVFDNFIQALCRIDIKSFEMEIISYYKGKKEFIARRIFLFQNKIYLVSNDSAEILIYDRKTTKENSLFFLFSFLCKKKIRYTVFEYEKIIYFFPKCIGEKIICFDLIKSKYYEKKLFDKSTLKKVNNCDTMGFSCVQGDSVWFVIYGTKFYVRYHIIDGNVDLFECLDSKMALKAICFDEKKIWLTSIYDNNIYCEGEQIIKIPGKESFSWLYNIDEYILALPGRDDRLILIHKNTLKKTEISLQSGHYLKQRKSNGSGMIRCIKHENYIFLFPYCIQDLFILEKRSLIIQKVELKCKNYLREYFKRNKKLICETEDIKLENLLWFCRKKSNFKYIEKINKEKCIWKTIIADRL